MILIGLPCFGRPGQTVDVVRRLSNTMGLVDNPIEIVLTIADQDAEIEELLHAGAADMYRYLKFIRTRHVLTYWQSLAEIRSQIQPGPDDLLIGLANDLLPGHEWLRRGLAAYRRRFGQGEGLMGFNDGIHGPELSPHFIIQESMLDRFGGWPTHYRHNYGDVELCRRAQIENRYGKAPWAVLYHDHHIVGAPKDYVYAHADTTWEQDAAIWERRRRELHL